MTQQYSRWQDLQQQPGRRRGLRQLEELRQRVHQFVIDQVGPMLSDEDVEPSTSSAASCTSTCTRR